MTDNGLPYFIEQLRYITAVTEMLNNADLPACDGMYIHVELREDADHSKLGQWSDEIAGNAWYYEENRD